VTNYQNAKTDLKQLAKDLKSNFPNDLPLQNQGINDYCDHLCKNAGLSDYQKRLLENYACSLHPKR
jgi:hypothetical protein